MKDLSNGDSVSICKTINILLQVMKDRGHYILDGENPDCLLNEISYDPDRDELYFSCLDVEDVWCKKCQ